MSLFGLSLRKKQKLYAAVDVGSHFIRALIFEERKNDPVPKVVKKMVIKLPASYDKERIFGKMRELMFAMVKELERIPEKITIALGPHLVEHSLKVWTVPKVNSGKKLTRKDLNLYLSNLFSENRPKELSSLAYPQGLLINDYPVSLRDLESSKPLTVLSPEVDLSFKVVLLTFSPEIGKILSDMKESLGGMPIEFTPLVLAFKEALSRSLGIKDAFLVDVGGEETTLIFLRGGEIREVSKFPVGARHFIRGIAAAASMSFEEAEDANRQYIQGMLTESKKKELGDFLKKETEVWKRGFLEAMNPFYRVGLLPAKILLFGGGAYLPEIAEALRSPEWFKNFSYHDSPELKILEASALFEGNTLNGFIKGPEDVSLASLIIYSLKHEAIF